MGVGGVGGMWVCGAGWVRSGVGGGVDAGRWVGGVRGVGGVWVGAGWVRGG